VAQALWRVVDTRLIPLFSRQEMIGRVDHQGFAMRRYIPSWRNTFAPWAIGTVGRAGGSFIDVRLRMRLFEAICTAVWMTFACVGALVTSTTDLMSGHPDALLFLIAPLAGALMVVGSFGGRGRWLHEPLPRRACGLDGGLMAPPAAALPIRRAERGLEAEERSENAAAGATKRACLRRRALLPHLEQERIVDDYVSSTLRRLEHEGTDELEDARLELGRLELGLMDERVADGSVGLDKEPDLYATFAIEPGGERNLVARAYVFHPTADDRADVLGAERPPQPATLHRAHVDWFAAPDVGPLDRVLFAVARRRLDGRRARWRRLGLQGRRARDGGDDESD
jgi:hypothetical protein